MISLISTSLLAERFQSEILQYRAIFFFHMEPETKWQNKTKQNVLGKITLRTIYRTKRFLSKTQEAMPSDQLWVFGIRLYLPRILRNIIMTLPDHHTYQTIITIFSKITSNLTCFISFRIPFFKTTQMS